MLLVCGIHLQETRALCPVRSVSSETPLAQLRDVREDCMLVAAVVLVLSQGPLGVASTSK